MATTKPTVHFFYDVVCPYAYLASTAIRALCEGSGAELVYRPVLLGGILNALHPPGTPPVPVPAAKTMGNAVDLRRWAELRRVELHFPSDHPRRSVDAMRLLAAAELEKPAVLEALTHALYRAYWVLGLDLRDRAVL